jgi:hypothetical protein
MMKTTEIVLQALSCELIQPERVNQRVQKIKLSSYEDSPQKKEGIQETEVRR